MIQLKISSLPVDEAQNKLSLVTTFQDVRPLKGRAGLIDWRLNGKLSRLIHDSKFSGHRGEALLMPTRGRIDSQELLLLGVGRKNEITDQELPHLLSLIVEKIFMKKTLSFSLSLSDLIPGMFEWRNAVRLFVSMISGKSDEMSVSLIEDRPYVEDAKKRHMDFSYDVEVHYDVI